VGWWAIGLANLLFLAVGTAAILVGFCAIGWWHEFFGGELKTMVICSVLGIALLFGTKTSLYLLMKIQLRFPYAFAIAHTFIVLAPFLAILVYGYLLGSGMNH
jgi:hypothetical protein